MNKKNEYIRHRNFNNINNIYAYYLIIYCEIKKYKKKN